MTLSISVGDARDSVETPIQPTLPVDSLDTLASRKKREDTNFRFEVVARDDTPDSAEVLSGRKRTGTSFTFEAIASEPTADIAEALTEKSRTDTSFKFERQASPSDSEADAGSDFATLDVPEDASSSIPDDASAMAGRKRQDTNFKFELTTHDDSTGGAIVAAEALGGRTRKDTSFKIEIVASDPDVAEALELPKRKDTNFHFERTATPTDPGSEFGVGSGPTTTETQERAGSSDLAVETVDTALEKRHDTSFSFEVYAPVGGVVGATVRVFVSEADGE